MSAPQPQPTATRREQVLAVYRDDGGLDEALHADRSLSRRAPRASRSTDALRGSVARAAPAS